MNKEAEPHSINGEGQMIRDEKKRGKGKERKEMGERKKTGLTGVQR